MRLLRNAKRLLAGVTRHGALVGAVAGGVASAAVAGVAVVRRRRQSRVRRWTAVVGLGR